MGQGNRVHIPDGDYSVYSIRRTNSPEFSNCLLLDIDNKRGLTSFLTPREFEHTPTEVRIKDMTIQAVQ